MMRSPRLRAMRFEDHFQCIAYRLDPSAVPDYEPLGYKPKTFYLYNDAPTIAVPCTLDTGKLDCRYGYDVISNEWFYLARNKMNITRRLSMEGNPNLYASSDTSGDDAYVLKSDVSRALSKFILSNGLPLKAADDKSLKSISSPGFNRKNMTKLLEIVSSKTLSVISKEAHLGGRNYVITTDTGSDATHLKSIAVNLVYVSESDLAVRTIGHIPVETSRCNASIYAAYVRERMIQLGIHLGVTDMVSDTTNLLPAVARELGLNWHPCWMHVINLMAERVQACLNQPLDELDAVAGFYRYNVRLKELLEEHFQDLSPHICKWCRSRFLTLGFMIDDLLRLEAPIRELAVILQREENERVAKHNARPSNADDQIKPVTIPTLEEPCLTFLRVSSGLFRAFNAAILTLESDCFGTIAQVPEMIFSIRSEVGTVCPEALPFIDEKLDEYLSPDSEHSQVKYIKIACRLNPFCDLYFGGADLEEIDQIIRSRLPPPEKMDYQDAGESEDQQSQIPPHPFFTSMPVKVNQTRTNDEFDTYLAEYMDIQRNGRHNRQPSDALRWWLMMEKRMPNLSQMAIEFNQIPATSASSERTFSTSGNTITKKRLSLLNEHKENVVIVASNPDICNDIIDETISSDGFAKSFDQFE